jgi:YHS domain-containing protein
MKKSSSRITVSSVVGAALLCLMPHAAGFAQSYSIRPTCTPNGQCRVNTATFGFNDTNWREWPCQPRPEETDPATIGGTVIPTPPPTLQQPLPSAETLPAKPPLSGGGSILPPLQGPGSTTPPGAEGGDSTRPNNPDRKGPAGQNLEVPSPQGLQGIPEGLDLAPRQPDSKSKTEGSGIEPLIPPKDQLLPGGIAPEPLTPPSGSPAAPPPASPARDVPASKLPQDLTPPPALKPQEPSPDTPNKGSSLSRRRKDAVAASATAIPNDLPMQADWNASLAPDAVSGNHLRSTSFEQSAPEKGNPLRFALQGFCPVQLQEHDRWVAGKPDLQLAYDGQVFHFSSEAARRRFLAAPEKYAPVRSGNDAVLMVEENRTVPGSVNHSAVWRGQLYLFSTSATLAAFQEDPVRYADRTQHTHLLLPAESL